jgi:hypothetical protein
MSNAEIQKRHRQRRTEEKEIARDAMRALRKLRELVGKPGQGNEFQGALEAALDASRRYDDALVERMERA